MASVAAAARMIVSPARGGARPASSESEPTASDHDEQLSEKQ
jgi:hypothetical protein